VSAHKRGEHGGPARLDRVVQIGENGGGAGHERQPFTISAGNDRE
jgi:hypothetical protein